MKTINIFYTVVQGRRVENVKSLFNFIKSLYEKGQGSAETGTPLPLTKFIRSIYSTTCGIWFSDMAEFKVVLRLRISSKRS